MHLREPRKALIRDDGGGVARAVVVGAVAERHLGGLGAGGGPRERRREEIAAAVGEPAIHAGRRAVGVLAVQMLAKDAYRVPGLLQVGTEVPVRIERVVELAGDVDVHAAPVAWLGHADVVEVAARDQLGSARAAHWRVDHPVFGSCPAGWHFLD
eukprot:SAG31_NODE_207_length_20316_cov_20.465400_2_plen_155_part_00